MGHKRYSGNHPRFSKRADERYDAKEAYNKDLSDSARLHYLENVRHDHDSPAKNIKLLGKTVRKIEDAKKTLRAEHQQLSKREALKHPNPYYPRSIEIQDRMRDIDEHVINPFNDPRSPVKNIRHDHDSSDSMKDMTGKTNQKMIRQGEKGKNISKSMTALGVGKNFMSSEDLLQKHLKNISLKQDKEFPTTPKPPKGSPFDRHTDKHMKREAKRIARRTEGDEQDIYYEMLKKSKEPKRGEAGFQQDPQEAYYENMSDGSPFNACAIDEGGSGCIKKMGGSWRVISNKTDKPWPAKYSSESKAKAALRGYHAG